MICTNIRNIESFFDPCSLEPLSDPWLHIGCSKDFNKSTLDQVVARLKKCPWCSAEVTMSDFIPNRTLKSGLEEMQKQALAQFPPPEPSAPPMEEIKSPKNSIPQVNNQYQADKSAPQPLYPDLSLFDPIKSIPIGVAPHRPPSDCTTDNFERSNTSNPLTATSQMERRKLLPFSSTLSRSRQARNWWDTPLARKKKSAYAQLVSLARNAESNQWTSIGERKELCRAARDKINGFNHLSLTGEELSIVKYVIERTEKGAEFSTLVAEARFDAIARSLAMYADLGIYP